MREYLAYSKLGYLISQLLQAYVWKNSRAHWIRDCLAGNKPFSQLR